MMVSPILLLVVALALMCILVAAILLTLSEIDTHNDRLASKRMSATRRQLVEELTRVAGQPRS